MSDVGIGLGPRRCVGADDFTDVVILNSSGVCSGGERRLAIDVTLDISVSIDERCSGDGSMGYVRPGGGWR